MSTSVSDWKTSLEARLQTGISAIGLFRRPDSAGGALGWVLGLPIGALLAGVFLVVAHVFGVGEEGSSVLVFAVMGIVTGLALGNRLAGNLLRGRKDITKTFLLAVTDQEVHFIQCVPEGGGFSLGEDVARRPRHDCCIRIVQAPFANVFQVEIPLNEKEMLRGRVASVKQDGKGVSDVNYDASKNPNAAFELLKKVGPVERPTADAL